MFDIHIVKLYNLLTMNAPPLHKHHRATAIDLTTGKPLSRILLFMLPMILGNIIQQLYSLVDTVIVGQALGANALSGVGSTGAASMLILGLVGGLATGFSVIVSQRCGAKDEEGMRRSFAVSIVLMVALVSMLTVIALFVAKPMLTAMHTKQEFMRYAYDYIIVIFGGMLISAFNNLFGSILRAIGDSKIPLLFLILSCFINGGLDCLFVIALDMGVRGAAIATLIANAFSATLTFVYLWVRYPVLRIKPRHFRPDFKLYGHHLKLGLPMSLQMSVISIGMIFCQSALNTLSPIAVTSYVAAGKIDGLATSILNSFGGAMAMYVGQNFGAQKYDRIKTGVARTTVFAVCLALALTIIELSLYRPLIKLFISKSDQSEELFEYALRFLLLNSSFYIMLGTLCITRGALQGMGRGTIALVSGAAEVVMRVAISLMAMHFSSFLVVCLCNCSSWVAANLVLVPAFFVVIRKYIPLFGAAGRCVKLPNPSEIPNTRPNV